MILGETTTETQKRMRKDAEFRMEIEATPRRVFVWWPTRLEDGRVAWLETVMTCVRHVDRYPGQINRPWPSNPYDRFWHYRVYWPITPLPKEKKR